MIPRHRRRRERRRRREGGLSVRFPGGRTTELRGENQSPQPQKPKKPIDWFHFFARKSSEVMGHPWSFVIAVTVIIGWAVSGPLFGFSDTWQLVINTATTIVTFMMVFLIQNTQNRDARAVHLKLDELLHSMKGARNRLIDLEDLSEEELDKLQKEFARLRDRTGRHRQEKDKAG